MSATPEQLKRIRLIVTDVDGVLTDGKINLTEDGVEIKSFCAKDSPPLRLALMNGLKVAFVTGRRSNAVEKRVAQYGIKAHYKSELKETGFMNFIEKEYGLVKTEIAYIGDDLNDLAGMKQVGIAFCPADAAAEVKDIAAIHTSAKGGEGVLAEVIRMVMEAQGTWKSAVEKFEQEQYAKPN
ncbi:HAD hydrolase family protein [Candidatus Uhrbacteria bacterium]|nr:HAD hydrolase family protein [Candidatus Uhrbacteria bacterium]